jgi:hypothetical protein
MFRGIIDYRRKSDGDPVADEAAGMFIFASRRE